MRNMSSPNIEQEPCLPRLELWVQWSFRPRVCDLSGRVPFYLVVEISRTKGRVDEVDDETPVSILAKDTILDLGSALERGLLCIVPGADAPPITVTTSGPDADATVDHERDVVSLRPGPRVRALTPHCIAYAVDVAKLHGLEAQKRYLIKLSATATDEWTKRGLQWWQFGERPADLSQPGEVMAPPMVKFSVSNANFLAKTDVPMPPRFEYDLSVHCNTISLSKPSAWVTISVVAKLIESKAYTIYTNRDIERPFITALHRRIGLLDFDIVDLDSELVLSGGNKNRCGVRRDEALSSPPLHRSRFREFQPGQRYHMEVSLGPKDLETSLWRGLRIEDPRALVGRRLGLRLRPMETWWWAQTMGELFAGRDVVPRCLYTCPLLIQSESCARIHVVD